MPDFISQKTASDIIIKSLNIPDPGCFSDILKRPDYGPGVPGGVFITWHLLYDKCHHQHFLLQKDAKAQYNFYPAPRTVTADGAAGDFSRSDVVRHEKQIINMVFVQWIWLFIYLDGSKRILEIL